MIFPAETFTQTATTHQGGLGAVTDRNIGENFPY